MTEGYQQKGKGKRRKKPRIIELPEDLRITDKDYSDYLEHAKKSGTFYAIKFVKSTGEIREKLMQKGYVDEPVTVVKTDDSVKEVNIIQDTLDYLVENHLVDDEMIAEHIVSSKRNSGRGNFDILRRLHRKKLPEHVIEEVMAEYDDEHEELNDNSPIVKSGNQYQRRSSFRKEQDPFKKKQKIYQFLQGRGFSGEEIRTYMEEYYDD